MRFSIVTPTRNSERFLEQTLESVVSQEGDFEIQYVIIDAQSTDRTSDVVARYQLMLEQGEVGTRCSKVGMEFLSGNDKGMYDAISRGFSRSGGDVMAWINSDDVYLPGAFAAISQALRDFPEVTWLKGITSYIDESSRETQTGSCYLYDRRWIEKGLYGPLFTFIQQDSVFWKSSLWDQSGGLDPSLRFSGDYFLWRSFARFEHLYSLPIRVSCFRRHGAQLSTDIEAYWREASCKHRIPGLEKQRLLGRLLRSESLPRGLRLAVRRAGLGAPDYRFLARRAFQRPTQEMEDPADVIDDRITSAVLL